LSLPDDANMCPNLFPKGECAMFIECPHCGHNAALQMTATDGQTYAKCLECGDEMLVTAPPRHAPREAKEYNRAPDKTPTAFRIDLM